MNEETSKNQRSSNDSIKSLERQIVAGLGYGERAENEHEEGEMGGEKNTEQNRAQNISSTSLALRFFFSNC